jgi:hypothetical protein
VLKVIKQWWYQMITTEWIDPEEDFYVDPDYKVATGGACFYDPATGKRECE